MLEITRPSSSFWPSTVSKLLVVVSFRIEGCPPWPRLNDRTGRSR